MYCIAAILQVDDVSALYRITSFCWCFHHFISTIFCFRPCLSISQCSLSVFALDIIGHPGYLAPRAWWTDHSSGFAASAVTVQTAQLRQTVKPSQTSLWVGVTTCHYVSLRVTTCHSLRLGSWWFQSMSQTCCANSSKMAHNIAKSLNVTLSCNDLGIQVKF